MLFADSLYLNCYDELQAEQKKKTLDALHEINNLDFNDPLSELKALQIEKEFDEVIDNKISECRRLAKRYSVYVLPFGVGVLLISFYLIQFISFIL